MKKNIFKSNGFQSLLASLLCIVLGLFLGYLVLLVINPAGAGEAILTVVKNFLTYKKTSSQLNPDVPRKISYYTLIFGK